LALKTGWVRAWCAVARRDRSRRSRRCSPGGSGSRQAALRGQTFQRSRADASMSPSSAPARRGGVASGGERWPFGRRRRIIANCGRGVDPDGDDSGALTIRPVPHSGALAWEGRTGPRGYGSTAAGRDAALTGARSAPDAPRPSPAASFRNPVPDRGTRLRKFGAVAEAGPDLRSARMHFPSRGRAGPSSPEPSDLGLSE
jgi:hypothetical protein